MLGAGSRLRMVRRVGVGVAARRRSLTRRQFMALVVTVLLGAGIAAAAVYEQASLATALVGLVGIMIFLAVLQLRRRMSQEFRSATARLPAKVGMHVRQSDRLVTGADGAVGVTFLDNTLVSTGPNSALVIDTYRFDSTTHAGKFDASLQRGSLAVISGKMVKQSPEAMRIRTPSSVLGVRGTEFVVKVADTD